MFRHLLRVIVGVIVASGSLVCLPSSAQAQGFMGGGGDFMSDPFNFYYAFYLPNQQLQAMRPTPDRHAEQCGCAATVLLPDG